MAAIVFVTSLRDNRLEVNLAWWMRKADETSLMQRSYASGLPATIVSEHDPVAIRR